MSQLTRNRARLHAGGSIAIPTVIFAIAFAARLLSLLRMGGFHHLMGYDEGVYFGSSTGMVAGLLPYRDFVFVHPPGVLVLLSPFASLSHLTSDTTGWTAARLAIMCVGAANAMLVYLIAHRVSLVAAIVGGGLYAVWSPAVWVERTTMLEAFVMLGTLLALWTIRGPDESARRLIIAGVFLGMAASVKLWGLVPLVVVIVWLLVTHAPKAAGWVGVGASATVAATLGPFFIAAPHQMFDMIVMGQITRARGGADAFARVGRMLNFDVHQMAAQPLLETAATLLGITLVTLAIMVTWRRLAITRLWSSLLIVQILVLLATPVYFKGYSSFIAPALMLVVGSAVAVVWNAVSTTRPILRTLGVAGLIAVLMLVFTASLERSVLAGVRIHSGLSDTAPFLASARCVGSDSAGILILGNVLTRNLDRGCVSVFDFDGTIYSLDSGSFPGGLSAKNRRLRSTQYQVLLQQYMRANDVMMLHRGKTDGLSRQTRAMLRARPLLVRVRGQKLFGTMPSVAPSARLR